MGEFRRAIEERRVIVCAGSGGVGKTTVSSVVAMHAAITGRKALVMTIDPARRLANSLGVSELDNELKRLDLSAMQLVDVEVEGELWATMLDMRQAFDELIEREAPDEETRREIRDNRFYKYFSTSLAGSQELAAMERLHDIVKAGGFDLVVLDTPPTAHALDFLDAPLRFFDALDSAALQWIAQITGRATRRGGILNVGTTFVLKNLARFTGTELLEELGTFLRHFSGLFEGFKRRADATNRILHDEKTGFVIVTSPNPVTVSEAGYFRERLEEHGVRLSGVVVNRVHEAFDGELPAEHESVTDELMQIPGARLIGRPVVGHLARKLVKNGREFDALAERDERAIEALGRLFGERARLQSVPLFPTDIHSVIGLEQVRRALFDLEPLDDDKLRRARRSVADPS